jgi:ABC-type transporter Mla MlaB component
MAAIPRGIHNRDCVRLQLLLDLPRNHKNRNESLSVAMANNSVGTLILASELQNKD